MKPISPPIGEPRVYDGESVPVIYPGEVAQARIDPEVLFAALQRGEHEVSISGWTVEPMPGWDGWWLRVRYRVWGRWFATGAPRLEVSIAPQRTPR